jgi:uncharacterized protein YnzC (UPF0291/DUF896 family)
MDDFRFTSRLLVKLDSLLFFEGGISIGALKACLKADYSNMLKMCRMEDVPYILRRIQEDLLLPHWPPMVTWESSNLERMEQQLRQDYMDQVSSSIAHFLQRIQVIMGIADLDSADMRQVEKCRNSRRLVHHPDKGGRREYYNFLDNIMEHLNQHWFYIDASASIALIAEGTEVVFVGQMQTCSIRQLPELFAQVQRKVTMPNESEHLQLVVVER